MRILNQQEVKNWLKHSKHPLAEVTYKRLKQWRNFEITAPHTVLVVLYHSYIFFRSLLANGARIFFWTPLIKGRLNSVGKNLYLYGGLPHVSGPLRVKIGSDCRISGQTTFSGRTSGAIEPVLTVGNNVDIGWMTTVAVGGETVLGDNVRIAGRCLLLGYPGHPLDAKARAAGFPETDDQVGNIILENDVWLATGVSVLAGVRIGKGSIVAAGSVVTKDLPANVLAAGVPAKVIRALDRPDEKNRQPRGISDAA